MSDWFRTIALILLLAIAWLCADFFVAESAAGRSVEFGPLAGMGPGEQASDLAPLVERFFDYLSIVSGGALSTFLMVGLGVCGALLVTLLVLGRNGWQPRAQPMKTSRPKSARCVCGGGAEALDGFLHAVDGGPRPARRPQDVDPRGPTTLSVSDTATDTNCTTMTDDYNDLRRDDDRRLRT